MTVPNTRGRRVGRNASWLAVAAFGANALAYVMSLLLSRGLGPAAYGAMAALLALAVIGAFPSQAEQFVATREVARDRTATPGTERAWIVGIGLAALCAVLSIPVATLLTLPSNADLALLGLVLLPLTVTGARQGVLLGSDRVVAFGAVMVSLSGGRLTLAVLAMAFGGGVTAILVAAAVASWLSLGLAMFLTKGHVSRHGALPWADLVPAVSAIACVFVITNLDVVAARALLPAEVSGTYAVAGLFARVAFWGPYVVVLVVFPMVARGEGGRRLLALALTVTVGAGGLLAFGAALFGAWFITVTSGVAYASATSFAPWMALLGSVGAALQLLLLHALARRDRAVESIVWLAAGTELVLLAVIRPSAPGGIIVIAAGVQLAAAVFGGVREWSDQEERA